MAENTNEPKNAETAADAPAEGAATATPAAKPAGKGLALPVLLGVVVVAAGAGFALGDFVVAPRVVAARSAKPAAAATPEDGKEHGKKGKEAKASVFKIDNVVVNPLGSEGSRFLMASIAIEVSDDKALDRLREKDAQVRDLVTSILESKSMNALTRPGARDDLKRELVKAVQPITGGTPRVYLPHFVIQ